MQGKETLAFYSEYDVEFDGWGLGFSKAIDRWLLLASTQRFTADRQEFRENVNERVSVEFVKRYNRVGTGYVIHAGQTNTLTVFGGYLAESIERSGVRSTMFSVRDLFLDDTDDGYFIGMSWRGLLTDQLEAELAVEQFDAVEHATISAVHARYHVTEHWSVGGGWTYLEGNDIVGASIRLNY